MPSKSKKFNGKEYKYRKTFGSRYKKPKTKARQYANLLRSKGNLARIEKAGKGTWNTWYNVYSRKR